MKTCSKCKEIKNIEDFHKQVDKKDGRAFHCKACRKAKSAKYYVVNKEKINAQNADYYSSNKDKHKVLTANYYRKNKAVANAQARKWQEDNVDRAKARSLRYYAEHKADYTVRSAKYRATKRQQSPAWADVVAIEEVYKYAKLIQNLTGVSIHVDHIIPLTNEKVSGLHVHHNLQIIPGVMNLSKNNQYEVAA